MVIVRVQLRRSHNLLHVIEASGCLGALFCRGKDRQQNSRQNRNNSNDNEQLNKGEAPPARLPAPAEPEPRTRVKRSLRIHRSLITNRIRGEKLHRKLQILIVPTQNDAIHFNFCLSHHHIGVQLRPKRDNYFPFYCPITEITSPGCNGISLPSSNIFGSTCVSTVLRFKIICCGSCEPV